MTSTNIDAIAGSDYVSVDQIVSFQPNEICRTQQLQILDDNSLETPECFQVSLFNPIGGVLGVQRNAAVTIKDNDCKSVYKLNSRCVFCGKQQKNE